MVDFRQRLLKCDFPLELLFFLKHFFQSLECIAVNTRKVTAGEIGSLLRFSFLMVESLALGFDPIKSRALLVSGLCQCCLQYLQRRGFKHLKDLTEDIAIELIADKPGAGFA